MSLIILYATLSARKKFLNFKCAFNKYYEISKQSTLKENEKINWKIKFFKFFIAAYIHYEIFFHNNEFLVLLPSNIILRKHLLETETTQATISSGEKMNSTKILYSVYWRFQNFANYVYTLPANTRPKSCSLSCCEPTVPSNSSPHLSIFSDASSDSGLKLITVMSFAWIAHFFL